MLGESPQRDRDIEDLQTMIKNCATAGIPVSNTTYKSSETCVPAARPDAGMQRTAPGNLRKQNRKRR